MIEKVRAALLRGMALDTQNRTGKAISRDAGLSESAVRDLLKKRTEDPRLGTLIRLAEVLGIRPGAFLDDVIHTTGTVGARGLVKPPLPDAGQRVPSMPLAKGKIEALVIAGDSLLPTHGNGDVVYFRERHTVDEDCLGKECVAELLDGSATFLRVVVAGERGTHTLLGCPGAGAVENVELAWASPVLFTMRAIARDEADLSASPPPDLTGD